MLVSKVARIHDRLAGRRVARPAHAVIVSPRRSTLIAADGGVHSAQLARLTMDADDLDRLWINPNPARSPPPATAAPRRHPSATTPPRLKAAGRLLRDPAARIRTSPVTSTSCPSTQAGPVLLPAGSNGVSAPGFALSAARNRGCSRLTAGRATAVWHGKERRVPLSRVRVEHKPGVRFPALSLRPLPV
jgi:hypothetical protein